MPRKLPPLLALLADFSRACEEIEVRWYLFGAQAAVLEQDDLLPTFERLLREGTRR